MNSQHKYGATNASSKYVLYVLGLLSVLFGFLFLSLSIFLLVKGKPTSLFQSIEIFLMASIVVPLIFLYVDFLETEICVDESGIDLKSPLRTFHLNWEEVVEIRSASLFGIPMFNSPNIVITNGKLTPFHYLYGLVYSRVFKPSFYFSGLISDSHKLRRAIVDGVKKS
ncbi:MAG: hypothetical protein QM730_11515 [Anaerolineales bacterium]